MKLNFNNFLQVAFIVGMMTMGRVAWADLNEGLIAYYPFNGNANDESGNGLDGTVNGATLTVDQFGSVDSAYDFDGTDDYIKINNNALFEVSSLTISAWVKWTGNTPSDHHAIVSNYSGYRSASDELQHYGLRIEKQSKFSEFFYDDGSQWDDVVNISNIGDGEWRFITGVLNSGIDAKIYVDGQLENIDTDSIPTSILPSGDLYIGRDGRAEAELKWNGAIDEVRIYNRALSECEIQSLYTGEDKCDSPPPVNVNQASCQLYAVNDKGLNNSQFFTVNLADLSVSELGAMYEGHDIEALAIHPQTNMVYAASGDDVTNGKPGHFYRVGGELGELSSVGSTGFKEIEDLAFSPDGTLYAWAKGVGLITINLATGEGTVVLDSDIPLEGLTLKKGEDNVFFGAVGTELWQYDGNTNTLEVLCPNDLLGETEALEITPEGLLLVGTHNVPFGLHAFDTQTCQVIEADETLTNQFDDVEGIALPVEACNSTPTPPSSCEALAEDDLQVFEAIFMEPFTLYMAIRSMVVVDYDIMGEWPIPLSTSITPPTGNFTASFVTGESPLYIDATMRSQAELEEALAAFNLDSANKACLAEVAGKVIRFIFNPDTRVWSCSVNIPNGVPSQHLDLFPMKCD
jgi:hypothetical protein